MRGGRQEGVPSLLHPAERANEVKTAAACKSLPEQPQSIKNTRLCLLLSLLPPPSTPPPTLGRGTAQHAVVLTLPLCPPLPHPSTHACTHA